nr:terminase small subunit [Amylibacter sp.]
MTPAPAEPLLNRGQIAQCFNVSENTINKWVGKGMPVETEGGNGVAYEFRFSECEQWFKEAQKAAAAEKAAANEFVAQRRMEFLGVEKDDARAGFTPAQMRELAQAELVWMQAAKQRGALVPTDEMVELLDTVFSEMRAGLDGLPDWLEREFSLSGEGVAAVIKYNDGILRAVQHAIKEAALSSVIEGDDPLEDGFL